MTTVLRSRSGPTVAGLFGCVLCLTLVPAAADAQIALLDKVFGKVTDFNIHVIYGWLNQTENLTTGDPGQPQERAGLYGVGFEVGVLVGTFGETDAPDTTWKTTGRDHEWDPVNLSDSSRSFEPEVTIYPVWNLGLTLGFSQLTGFRGLDANPDLRGSVQELPAVGLYLTYVPADPISFYLGVRSGLLTLSNLRATGSADTLYTAGGTTVQMGGAVGLLAEIGGLHIFLEPRYTHRRFRSLDWKSPNDVLPSEFPRELNFTGLSVAAGLQVGLPGK